MEQNMKSELLQRGRKGRDGFRVVLSAAVVVALCILLGRSLSDARPATLRGTAEMLFVDGRIFGTV